MAVSFIVYFNALFNGFVDDDTLIVVDNPWIKDLKFLTNIFTADVFGFTDPRLPIKTHYYRPLVHVIHMFSFYLLGLKPFVFHLVNVLFHAGNSVLVFMIASLLPGKTRPRTSAPPATLLSYLSSTPFLAALLFATHPIHTEAVTWVSGLFDVSFAFFYLLSLLFYMRYKEGFRAGYILSLAAFFASTLCKEPALTLPLVLIGYDYAFREKEDRLPTLVRRYVPYFVIAVIYMALRTMALKSFNTIDAPEAITGIYNKGMSTWQYVINVFPIFMEYLKDLFFPVALNLHHTFRPIKSIFTITGILSMVITVVYLLIVFFAWKRNRAIFFGLLFIIVPLLPAFYIKGIGGNYYGERYLYLPSFGFVVLLATSFSVLKKKMARYGIVAVLIALAVVGLYSVRTITRNLIWKDQLTLYTDTVNKSPETEVPHVNLGRALMGMDRNGEAIEQYRKALELNPTDYVARQYLAEAYMKSGMIEQTNEQFQEIMKLNPNFLLTWIDFLSQHKDSIDLQKKRLMEEAIEQAVKLQPNNALYRNVLGIVYGGKGGYDKAIEQFKVAVQLDASNPAFRKNLDIAIALKNSAGKPSSE